MPAVATPRVSPRREQFQRVRSRRRSEGAPGRPRLAEVDLAGRPGRRMRIPGKMPAFMAFVGCSAIGFACGSSSGGSAGPTDGGGASDASSGSTSPVADGNTPAIEASVADSALGESEALSDSGIPNGDAAAAGDAGFPPIDPSTLIADLTDTQRGELCDWMLGGLGAYARSPRARCRPCRIRPTGRSASPTSLMFGCNVTVGDVEMCTVARLPSMGCDTPPACDAEYCQ
jgi:hypothetical protein